MATQQRPVVITAIVLAIIVGGALTWLLNRTPAEQLATQAPPINVPEVATGDDLFLEDGAPLAQAQGQQPDQNQISPVQDETQLRQQGQTQGVSVSAPTGPAHMALIMGAGLTGLLGLARVTWLRG